MCYVICCNTTTKYYNIWATFALVHQISNIIKEINLTLGVLILNFLGEKGINLIKPQMTSKLSCYPCG
jgi:hypothetical protein